MAATRQFAESREDFKDFRLKVVAASLLHLFYVHYSLFHWEVCKAFSFFLCFWVRNNGQYVYLPWKELISQTQLDKVSALHLRQSVLGIQMKTLLGEALDDEELKTQKLFPSKSSEDTLQRLQKEKISSQEEKDLCCSSSHFGFKKKKKKRDTCPRNFISKEMWRHFYKPFLATDSFVYPQ